MPKLWRASKITRRGKNNTKSNALTEAIAIKEAKRDIKQLKKGGKK